METIQRIIDDLLSRPERAEYLNVATDCPDLTASIDPLRAAFRGDNAAAAARRQIERLHAYCTR